ncbi:MAG: SIMPL domain-containing protein [Aureliella sp.]
MVQLMLLLSLFAAVAEGEPRISIQGEGNAEAVPDIFYLDISVQLRDQDLEGLRSEVTERCRRIVAAAKSFDLNKEQTFTREFTIQPQFDNQRKFLGYTATQKFRLALNNLAQAEKLTAAVLKAGATTIEHAEFTVKDATALWEKAREASVADALQRAKRMTAVLESRPGQPLRILDQGKQLVLLGCAWNSGGATESGGTGRGLPDGDGAHFVPPTAVKFQVKVQVDFSIVPIGAEPKS